MPRIGIGVAGAAEHEHRLGFWVVLLDVGLGIAGVIATELVIVRAQRGAVDGGAEEHAARFAIATVDAQNGNGAVGQAAWIDAEDNTFGREFSAVHDKVDHAAAPRELGRLQTGRRLHDGFDHLVLKFGRVYSTVRSPRQRSCLWP